jgi:hypothetical protein
MRKMFRSRCALENPSSDESIVRTCRLCDEATSHAQVHVRAYAHVIAVEQHDGATLRLLEQTVLKRVGDRRLAAARQTCARTREIAQMFTCAHH